jgi:hypothetical protein
MRRAVDTFRISSNTLHSVELLLRITCLLRQILLLQNYLGTLWFGRKGTFPTVHIYQPVRTSRLASHEPCFRSAGHVMRSRPTSPCSRATRDNT